MGRRQIQLLLWPRLPKGSLGQATLEKFGLDQADQRTKAGQCSGSGPSTAFQRQGFPHAPVEAKATKAARLAAV